MWTTPVAPEQKQPVHEGGDDNHTRLLLLILLLLLLLLLLQVLSIDARLRQLQLSAVALGPIRVQVHAHSVTV